MKRLLFRHLFISFTLLSSSFASDLRDTLRSKVNDLTHQNCSENLDVVHSILEDVSFDEYKKEIHEYGHEQILHDLWSFKLTLHERLKSFERTVSLSKSCADASRHAFRSIRTAEDYVNEHYLRSQNGDIKFPDNAFEEGNIHVRRHPEMSNFDLKKDLKSGDILLTRGNAFTSAAIANLGEFDTQFSHMSMVYRDKNGKIWTVEAHIEVGSFVRTLEDHIADKNYRTMVYRFEDEELASKAADYIFHKVKKASDTTGNIFYDFGFDQDDSKELFCSEVVSHAFDHVSGNKVSLPMFKSRLQSRKPEFVKMLGIKAQESFVPADIEVDPRFTIIAEWRDSNRTNDNLQKDAVLQAMFRWNDELGYQMVQASSKKSLMYRNIAWPMRRVPFLKKYFIEKMPMNMSRSLIGYFGVLESIGEMLQKELKSLDEKAVEERGIPLLESEKYDVLDEFRRLDLQGKRKLHKMYKSSVK